jgi:hypothetical protein
MNVTTVILAVASMAAFGVYLMRRRARLSSEE